MNVSARAPVCALMFSQLEVCAIVYLLGCRTMPLKALALFFSQIADHPCTVHFARSYAAHESSHFLEAALAIDCDVSRPKAHQSSFCAEAALAT